MSSFEDRVARVEAKRLQARAQTPVAASNDGLSPRHIAMVPLAILLGALAVVIGGVIQVAVLNGGYTPATSIPPQLNFPAFLVALGLSLVADKVLRMGMVGNLGVTLGFVCMIFGEGYLAATFPDLWIGLYGGGFSGAPEGAQIAANGLNGPGAVPQTAPK